MKSIASDSWKTQSTKAEWYSEETLCVTTTVTTQCSRSKARQAAICRRRSSLMRSCACRIATEKFGCDERVHASEVRRDRENPWERPRVRRYMGIATESEDPNSFFAHENSGLPVEEKSFMVTNLRGFSGKNMRSTSLPTSSDSRS